jgi:DNA-directed RNA polymerase subunit RPC12/RpoP
MTVKCPHCGYQYAVGPGERCIHCGKDMAGNEGAVIFCPRCGAKNTRTERQCVRCDAELTTAKERIGSSQMTPNAFEQDVLNYLKRIDERVSFLYWLAVLGIFLAVLAFLISLGMIASVG